MIDEQIGKQNQQALLPHEWAVFEEVLSKPFFLNLCHKKPIKTAASEVREP